MKVKVGDKIKIIDFARDSDGTLPKSEQNLIGKTGVVTSINEDMGIIYGTWGSLGLLKDDIYEVIG